MAELLLELFSEEIPARMQARAAEELKRLVCDGLKDAGLDFADARAFATPRRLALVVDGIPERQPDIREEKKGPRVGAPDKAIEGFLRGAGLDSLDQCEKRETPKGDIWFAVVERKGRDTEAVLPDLLIEAIRGLVWPKSMRWAGNGFRWVRPLHSILAAFDGAQLKGALDLGDETVAFGAHTHGHRFLSADHIMVNNFGDYVVGLKNNKVILDPAGRRAIIADGLAALAKNAKLTVRDDPALLDEVTGLVEWPVVLSGEIDDEFMDLPAEVLTTAMRSHQKYFALLDKDGGLAPRFALVSNMETRDKGKKIVAGNERVLRARLADARFFWDQDRKETLASRTPKLADIVFHAKLGTLDQKADRMQALAVEIAKHVPGADAKRVRAAASLAKADLVTGMVGEFPELQGLMGRYYALADGEHAEVADAIRDHYAPQGPNDACPTAPVSVAVALADKIDTLVGFWAIDEKPTGSKDPYALRRAALGVIRLVIENGLRLPLKKIFETAIALVSSKYDSALVGGNYMEGQEPLAVDRPSLIDSLLAFFADRLKVHLREQGVRHDLIAAVFALGGEDDLVRLLARVSALQDFIDSDDGANLLTAYRRAANIVRIEEGKDKTEYRNVKVRLFADEWENVLWQNLHAIQDSQQYALKHELYTVVMEGFSQLRRPVDVFFDRVTVNADDQDIRANRLALLRGIVTVMNQVADFSKIEG